MSDRHAYYLQLKARGYYQNACLCGRKKSIQARICKHCNASSPTRLIEVAELQHCACGRAKSRRAKRCLQCKIGAAKPHPTPVVVNPNPHCPNPGQGGAECLARYPHKHCACMDAIDLDKAMCGRCIRDSARGAAMTEEQSKDFEQGNKRLFRVA